MKRLFTRSLFLILFLQVGLFFHSSLSATEVEHKRGLSEITPLITCPQDVYVNCSHYSGDPTDYGQPIVNGHWQNVQIIEHPAQVSTNQCGIGAVIRSWTIHTPVGNFSCTQRIEITGNGNFGFADIQWPLDYTITDQCQGVPHPNDLPAPYNKPTWNQRACSMIGISYKDDVFYFGDPHGSAGCRKIVRTWKVIDWCQYSPNSNQGLWMKAQVIKIEDKQAPEFINCPSAFEVGVNNACNGAIVDFPIPIAVDNCNSTPKVTNNSSYSNQKGADASGFYPLGSNDVRFLAEDGCGNFDTCVVRVTVKDLKKPTPICYHGLTANLMQMGDDGFVRIHPKTFDAGSYDNCTPRSLLKFSAEPAEFTCENRGRNDIKIIVEDESGNTDYCITYVIIQDNMGMCPPDTTGGLIAGQVAFHNDEVLENVMLYVTDDAPMPASVTDIAGIYLLDKLAEGKTYQIRPTKSGALNEGVSTVDLIMLRQHITGEKLLEGPYKRIAADVNLDNKIDIQDLNQLRLIMMSGIQSFPGLVPWRFVDKSYSFTNPEQPLKEKFTEVYQIQNHTKVDMTLNFVGVKIGDFDGTCLDAPKDDEPVIFTQNGSRNSSHTSTIIVEDVDFGSGVDFQTTLTVSDMARVAGMQFTLKFDTDKIEFKGWQNATNDVFGGLRVSTVDVSNGIIYFSWDNENENLPSTGDKLGTLLFRSKSKGTLSDALGFISIPLLPQVYDLSLNPSELQLRFQANGSTSSQQLSWDSVYPNPFYNECQLKFISPIEGTVELQIMDLNGRILVSSWNTAVAGHNQLSLNASMLAGSGVYFAILKLGDQTTYQRIVLMD